MDSAICYHFHDQLFEVRSLLNTGILDAVLHIFDWCEDGINRDITKVSVFWFVLFCRNITTAFTDGDLDIQFCRWVQSADQQLRIHDLERLCSFSHHSCSEFSPVLYG